MDWEEQGRGTMVSEPQMLFSPLVVPGTGMPHNMMLMIGDLVHEGVSFIQQKLTTLQSLVEEFAASQDINTHSRRKIRLDESVSILPHCSEFIDTYYHFWSETRIF